MCPLLWKIPPPGELHAPTIVAKRDQSLLPIYAMQPHRRGTYGDSKRVDRFLDHNCSGVEKLRFGLCCLWADIARIAGCSLGDPSVAAPINNGELDDTDSPVNRAQASREPLSRAAPPWQVQHGTAGTAAKSLSFPAGNCSDKSRQCVRFFCCYAVQGSGRHSSRTGRPRPLDVDCPGGAMQSGVLCLESCHGVPRQVSGWIGRSRTMLKCTAMGTGVAAFRPRPRHLP